jgi:hypothetical protein
METGKRIHPEFPFKYLAILYVFWLLTLPREVFASWYLLSRQHGYYK